MKQFTKIVGLSESRRIPRLNKIRLGAKIQKANSTVEFPIELPFFLLPDEVAPIHGGEIPNIEKRAKELGLKQKAAIEFVKNNAHRLAEELPVMIPVEDENSSFPQAYKLYGGSIGLKCSGNGEEAMERVGITPEFKEKKCPCNQLKTNTNPGGKCSIVANLQVMLPEVSAGGVFQIDIGSINSIIDINSGIDYVRSIMGRVAMVPLILRRVPTETHHGGKKQTHFTVQLTMTGSLEAIAHMKQNQNIITHREMLLLDAPDDTDPMTHPVDAEYTQPENIKKMVDYLRGIAENKKLKQLEVDAVQTAIDMNDEQAIEEIFNIVQARIKTGSSASDVEKKLKQKAEPAQGKPAEQAESRF